MSMSSFYERNEMGCSRGQVGFLITSEPASKSTPFLAFEAISDGTSANL